MVARAFAAAKFRIDARGLEPARQCRVEQQEIHPEARVAPEVVRVHPERIDTLLRMQRPVRVDPSLCKEPPVRFAGLRLHHCIFALAKDFNVDVDIHLDGGYTTHDMDIWQVCDLTDRMGWGGRVTIGHGNK